MVEHLIVSYREEVAVQSGRTGRDNLKLVGRLYYKEDLLQALHTLFLQALYPNAETEHKQTLEFKKVSSK